MMNNLSLKNKILLVLALPIVMILGLSIESIYLELKEQSKIEKTKSYLQFSIVSSNLIHELQKERGYSAGYRISYGKNFSSELNEQRKQTNKKLSAFQTFAKTFDTTTFRPDLDKEIQTFLKKINTLNAHRDKTTKFNIEVSQVVGFYTQNINTLLKFMDGTISFCSDGDLALMAQSYLAIANMKEKSGIERAVVSGILLEGILTSNSFSKFSSLISAQNTYLETFNKAANKKQLEQLEKVKKTQHFLEVNKVRMMITSKTEKANLISDIKASVGYGGLVHNFKKLHIKKR